MLTVEVDLGAIARNVRSIRERVAARYCAVVKANAYGHGAVQTALFLEDKVDLFAVATLDEARELAAAGVKKDIYILGFDCETGEPLPPNVVPAVWETAQIKSLAGRSKRVNLAVNTGMNRLGCKPERAIGLLCEAQERGIAVEGAYTHFFNEADPAACAEQFDAFRRAYLPLRGAIKYFHACASNCLVLPEVYHLDMVRVGLATYGYGYPDLTTAMRVYTHVVAINEVKAGEHVSYGDFTAERDMRLATVRAGYGDGPDRGKGLVFSIGGQLCESVGRMCMDYCLVEVKNARCTVGDRAFLLGNGINMEFLTKKYSTISHEVLTLFNARARRIYVDESTNTQNNDRKKK